MNEKIKKTFRAMTSAALAGAFVVSSVIGGGADSFVSSSVVFAEENNSELSNGSYLVPVLRQKSVSDSTEYKYGAEHFRGQAVLNIENNQQTVTIGVENWSLYDAFIPVCQEYNSEVSTTNVLPLAVFSEENYSQFTNFTSYISTNENAISEEANDWYYYANNPDTNFGALTFQYDSSLDTAYVTFTIQDYTMPFAIQAWFNTPIDGDGKIKNIDSLGHCYNDLIVFDLYESGAQKFEYDDDVSSWDKAVRNTYSRMDRIQSSKTFFTQRIQTANPGTYKMRERFDDVSITNEDSKYIVKYHLTEGLAINEGTETFKVLNKINNSPDNQNLSYSWDAWDNWLTGSFEDIPVIDGWIALEFDSLFDALMGQYVYEYNTVNDIRVHQLSIAPLGDFVTIASEDIPEISIKGDMFCIPSDAKLKVLKNTVSSKDELVNEGITKEKYDQYTSSLYSDPIWYTICLVDSEGNIISNTNDAYLYVPIPTDFSKDKYFMDIIVDGEIECTSESFSLYTKVMDGCIEHYGKFNTAVSISMMTINETPNVSTLTKGIYEGNAYFVQKDKPALLSMADACLMKKVYISVSDEGTRKLYFKAGSVSRDDYTNAYMGDVFCNNPLVDDAAFPYTIQYTDFLIDDSGNLSNNTAYDAISEWACVKGGILTLIEDAYLANENVYELCVASPAMQTIGGLTYAEWDVDSLLVWLKVTDIKKSNDIINEEQIKEELDYGYQPSALLRKIRQAELKLERKNSYSSTSVTKLQSVYDAITKSYGSSYDSLSAANLSSNDIENMITDLDNAIKSLDSITVAGYNAQLDKDVTFDFYLSMNKNNLEAAQDGDLTANITKADGSTETVEVGEDGKIEFNVAPKEIGQTLKVKIGSYEFTYSVQEYLEKLIWYAENPTEGVEVSEKDAAIAKSLLVYGGYAQDYFVKKDAEANAYVDTERAYANVDNTLPETADNATTFTAPQLGDNIKYYGAAVVFDYTTDIRLYFTVDDAIENHSFAVNDKAVDAVAVDGGYYIAIENIYANQLGNPFKITVDGTDFQYGVYNYIAAALNATEVKSGALNELQALVKALYQYAELTKTTA